MTWYLCQDWEISPTNDQPCASFRLPEHTFTGPDIGYLFDYVYLECVAHPRATVDEYDNSDEFYEAVVDTWNNNGYSSCDYCGEWVNDWDGHFETHLRCTSYFNDAHNTWSHWMGEERNHADRWLAILTAHGIEPHAALRTYMTGFDHEHEVDHSLCDERQHRMRVINGEDCPLTACLTCGEVVAPAEPATPARPVLTIRDVWLAA